MTNILFRADSSSEIGIGHIMRDLVLASQYSNKDYNIIFATQNLNGNINHKILEAGYKLITLKSNSKKELVKLIDKLKIDLLVIDHYKINFKKEKYIKEKTAVKILSFDDTYEKHHCDILLNHNIGANKNKYLELVPKNCELRCGSKYTLIRNEFKKIKIKDRKINKQKKINVFISMGGTDNLNLNIEILKILKSIKNIKIHIISTTANSNLKKLKKYVQHSNNINLYVNSDKMAKIMNQCDLAIITPSVTIHEIIYMELPFIAIKTIDNQNEIYNYIKKDFLAIDVKDIKNLKKIITKIITKYNYFKKKLKKLYLSYKKL